MTTRNSSNGRLTTAVASGRLWQWVHGAGTIVWMCLLVPGMTVWRNSVPFVVFISLYAIILSHTVGLVASVGARKADKNDTLGE